MAQKIAILGTHWLAEEMFDLISEVPGYEVDVFVENMNPDRCNERIEGLPIVWVDELSMMTESHLAICALGSTHRRGFIEQASALGTEFATIVHPGARVSSRATLGVGCFVSAGCIVSTKSSLGDHVFLNRGVLVGHHVSIGRYCSVQCGANIAGLADIGESTYIGMGAVILDRVSTGPSCVIGAGSVVTESIPERVQVLGVPARIVKTNIEGK